MKKSNKVLVIILIIIIALSLNYVAYQYIYLPRHNSLQEVEADYIARENKLEELIKIKTNLESVKMENQVLKKDAEEINKLVAKEIDTPQLVYDFYESCKKYGIQGDEVSFSLSINEPPKEGEKSDMDEKDDVTRLEIFLKVTGEKKNIENYIRNLDKITERKLNVKSIRLSSKENENNTNLDDNVTLMLVRTNNMGAEISFYHYLKLTNEQTEEMKKHGFYPNTIGFDSIPAMFR